MLDVLSHSGGEGTAMDTFVSRRALISSLSLAAMSAGLGACGISGGRSTGLPGSSSLAKSTEQKPLVQQKLESMTLEQKVAQLFLVTPEQLTGVSQAVVAGSATQRALEDIPVGGLCYFAQNITGDQQLRDLLLGTYSMASRSGAGIAPFLTVDEEGGSLVSRVANSGYFDVQRFPNMAEVGATGDETQAAHVGATIGEYLHEIGFNVDFAPVADVLTNPSNEVIGPRAFSSDPDVVAQMVPAEVLAMLDTGTMPCIKHFPGHGDTAGDSHTGGAVSSRSAEEIRKCEYKPFQAGIDAGCPFVMVGHIETPNLAADGLPASLSKTMITDELRGRLGFGGVVISDSFVMGAITQRYASADAAVRFIQAGGDMVLMPENLQDAYQGLLEAVNEGVIEESRIDESVMRILKVKKRAGMLM